MQANQEYNTGFCVQAKVLSQHVLQCEEPSGSYNAEIKIKAFSPDEAKAAVSIIQQSNVWKQVVQHEPSVNHVSMLDALKFAQVPFELLEKVFKWPHVYASDNVTAKCNCKDEHWCKHIASLCYVLVDACEKKPVNFLRGMGVDLQVLLDQDRAAATTTCTELPKYKRHGWVHSPTAASAKRQACSASRDGAVAVQVWRGNADSPIVLD